MKFCLRLVLGMYLLSLSAAVFAHQPEFVDEPLFSIEDASKARAYFAELDGEPHVYQASSDTPFALYLGIFTPNILERYEDFVVEVIQREGGDFQLMLDGKNFEWSKFMDTHTGDYFYSGPFYGNASHGEEYVTKGKMVDPGTYEIRVYRPGNKGKYVLVYGEFEGYSLSEGLESLSTLSDVKTFMESDHSIIHMPIAKDSLFVLLFVFGGVAVVWYVRSSSSCKLK